MNHRAICFGCGERLAPLRGHSPAACARRRLSDAGAFAPVADTGDEHVMLETGARYRVLALLLNEQATHELILKLSELGWRNIVGPWSRLDRNPPDWPHEPAIPSGPGVVARFEAHWGGPRGPVGLLHPMAPFAAGAVRYVALWKDEPAPAPRPSPSSPSSPSPAPAPAPEPPRMIPADKPPPSPAAPMVGLGGLLLVVVGMSFLAGRRRS